MGLSSPEERAAYLQQACAGDLALKAEIESLLQAEQDAGSFLGKREPRLVAKIADPIGERPGTVIGPYKLMEQIGEGGMGLVFVAEQQQPVRRKVALKVIKPGMDSRQVVARFEAERQALALMDHPHIAKVYDGGQTAGGRPYFVMELVKGVPITEYCDHNQVPICQRVKLFIDVCHTVLHAHQKGIIHRDIKPSNVLVASHDGVPIVKIIDFGVAKAVGQQLTERTIYTQFTQMIGTPLYMSPEQAGQSALDVDTRSDIYSLGVLLYELLTGTTPFERERLKEMTYEEIRRTIREEDPPRPSTRISTLGQAATTVSLQRQSDPKRLSQLFRGELDWIVMKALEKDRNRRYETAAALAADVERYLADEPVQASPPSAWYRLRKLARRNKGKLTTLALVLGVLLVGTGVSAWQAFRAQTELREKRRQYKRAEVNFQKSLAAVDELLTAVGQDTLAHVPHLEQIRRKLLEKALRFYQGFLEEKGTDPAVRLQTGMAYRRAGEIEQTLGKLQAAAESLNQGVALLDDLAAEFPSVQEFRQELARCRYQQAKLLRHTGSPQHAEERYHQALDLQDRLVKDDANNPDYHNDRAASRDGLASLLKETGRPADAEQTYRQAVEEVASLVRDYPGRPAYAKSLTREYNNLANLLVQGARLGEAEQLFRQAIEVGERVVGQFPEEREHQKMVAGAYTNLAILYLNTSRFADAEQAGRHVVSLQKQLAADFAGRPNYSWEWARALESLGGTLWRGNQADKAADAWEQGQKLLRELTTEYPGVPEYEALFGGLLNNLAILHDQRGEPAKARPLIEEAIDHHRIAVAANPKNPGYRRSLANAYSLLATVLGHLQAPPAEAVRAHQQAIEALKDLARDFPTVPDYASSAGASLSGLALFLRERGRLGEARPLLEEAVRYQRAAFKANPRSPAYREFLHRHYFLLAETLAGFNFAREAIEAYRQDIAILEDLVRDFPEPSDHRHALVLTYLALANLLDRTDRGGEQEQEQSYRKAVAVAQGLADASSGAAADQSTLGAALSDFAGLFMRRGLWADARKLLEQAVARQQTALASNPKDPTIRRYLGIHYRLLSEVLLRQALAAEKMGAHEAAREGYREAIRMIQEHQLDDGELHRQRGEAAELLKLKKEW
jgi:serine/threonine protein kinase